MHAYVVYIVPSSSHTALTISIHHLTSKRVTRRRDERKGEKKKKQQAVKENSLQTFYHLRQSLWNWRAHQKMWKHKWKGNARIRLNLYLTDSFHCWYQYGAIVLLSHSANYLECCHGSCFSVCLETRCRRRRRHSLDGKKVFLFFSRYEMKKEQMGWPSFLPSFGQSKNFWQVMFSQLTCVPFFPFVASFHRQIIKSEEEEETKRMGRMEEISPPKKKGFTCRDCKLALLLEKVNVRKITKYLFSPVWRFSATVVVSFESRNTECGVTSVKVFIAKVKTTPNRGSKFHVDRKKKKRRTGITLINISFIHTQNHSQRQCSHKRESTPHSLREFMLLFALLLLANFYWYQIIFCRICREKS